MAAPAPSVTEPQVAVPLAAQTTVETVKPSTIESEVQGEVQGQAGVTEKLSKMNLTELKALSKKAGIKLSHYDRVKSKSIAKTRKMLISDLTVYCNKL